MRFPFVLGIILVLLPGTRPADKFPQAEITNGLIHAKLYLPDSKKGYYRGSRFDWSAVMPELKYDGHTYFGQWFTKYDPLLHDAITGPVEAFNPVGYDDAKVGESFLKVGIGMVKKPDEAKYFFANDYPIMDGGKWKTKVGADNVVFTHKLDDKEYAYDYVKTVQLTKGKPEMVLLHTLKNRGKKTIESDVYNHNFFVMDNHPIGPDYVVTFPFNLEGTREGENGFGRIEDNQIVYEKDLGSNGHLHYKSLKGFGDSAEDYDIKIENHKTGAAVRITGDQPLTKIVFWSAPKTICPEPYIYIKVDPGETVEWKISYQFYTIATR